MNDSRLKKGIDQLSRVDGEAGEKVIHSLEEIAPDIATYILEFAFGDIYSRAQLSLAKREIITIASLLTTGGCEPQLEVHINGALNVGVSAETIIETCIQCIPYTGFPKVLNAITVIKKVFSEREIIVVQKEAT